MAVVGAGPIGLAQLQLAKLYGTNALVADVAEFPLKMAAELGADVVVNTTKQDGLAKLKAFKDENRSIFVGITM